MHLHGAALGTLQISGPAQTCALSPAGQMNLPIIVFVIAQSGIIWLYGWCWLHMRVCYFSSCVCQHFVIYNAARKQSYAQFGIAEACSNPNYCAVVAMLYARNIFACVVCICTVQRDDAHSKCTRTYGKYALRLPALGFGVLAAPRTCFRLITLGKRIARAPKHYNGVNICTRECIRMCNNIGGCRTWLHFHINIYTH